MWIFIFSDYASSWDYDTFSKHMYKLTMSFHNLFFSLNDIFIVSSLTADEINCFSAAQQAFSIHYINICQAVLKMLGVDTEQNIQSQLLWSCNSSVRRL